MPTLLQAKIEPLNLGTAEALDSKLFQIVIGYQKQVLLLM